MRAVRRGGAIILCASCKEGFGNSVFEDWMLHMTREQMQSSIWENFVLGGHKAAAIASAAERATIYMVTDMDVKSIEGIGFKCCASVQQAFATACHDLGSTGRIIVMPEGGKVLPD